MQVLLIDGHPDSSRLSAALLDIYQASLPPGTELTRIALRDLEFAPNLRYGYAQRTPWEPDLDRLARLLDACDHLAIAFPMWWGAEPALVKGLLDRLLLPGFAFAYRDGSSLWDRYLEGRSADAIITMDTPPWFLRLGYNNAIVNRWRKQVLGFCGFRPARVLSLGPVKNGAAERHLADWRARIEKMASTAGPRHPLRKQLRLEAFLARKPKA